MHPCDADSRSCLRLVFGGLGRERDNGGMVVVHCCSVRLTGIRSLEGGNGRTGTFFCWINYDTHLIYMRVASSGESSDNY